jgi:hypothetical protein
MHVRFFDSVILYFVAVPFNVDVAYAAGGVISAGRVISHERYVKVSIVFH